MIVVKVNLEFLYSFINTSEVSDNVSAYMFENIETGFEISPSEFIKFADCDLTAQYNHHLINCLSNTKRAIDSQLDSLLIGFGISERSKNWHFPDKVNFLNSIGVISPGILKKINRKRNFLEHEYIYPSKEEVEDALDVAKLFVAYTNKYLFRANTGFELFIEGEGYIEINLDWEKHKITCTYRTDDIYNKYKDFVTEDLVSADQKEYDEYLKYYLKLYDIA